MDVRYEIGCWWVRVTITLIFHCIQNIMATCVFFKCVGPYRESECKVKNKTNLSAHIRPKNIRHNCTIEPSWQKLSLSIDQRECTWWSDYCKERVMSGLCYSCSASGVLRAGRIASIEQGQLSTTVSCLSSNYLTQERVKMLSYSIRQTRSIVVL